MAERVASLREALDFMAREGELLTTQQEVDPDLEIAGIMKALDNSIPILFEKLKGYPEARFACNLYARPESMLKLFGAADFKELKARLRQGARKPLPPKVVETAPCQEVVITDAIDVRSVVPMISHTVQDPGRTLGGGITCVSGKYFDGGSHLGFHRMNFRGQDYSSFQIAPGGHMWQVATKYYAREPIPLTVNMGVPPAILIAAGGAFDYLVLPFGCDELGLAGATQGFPMEIVKARTVDAYAIANAEIVIEGYLDTTQRVWESPLAEEAQRQGVFPFHPEWSGYMGRAYRTYKFTATAITFRRNPIYYNPIVHAYDCFYICSTVRDAALWAIADGICPGLVTDVYTPFAIPCWGGTIVQVKKRSRFDEGYQKNILATLISASQGMRLAIAVDDDINIYSTDDVLWALATRVEPDRDLQVVAAGGRGQTFQPAERAAAAPGREWLSHEVRYSGGLAFDATVPWEFRDAFERPHYPVEKVKDLTRWFSQADIERAQALQCEYARFLAQSSY